MTSQLRRKLQQQSRVCERGYLETVGKGPPQFGCRAIVRMVSETHNDGRHLSAHGSAALASLPAMACAKEAAAIDDCHYRNCNADHDEVKQILKTPLGMLEFTDRRK